MRVVVLKVKRAQVTVDNEVVGKIDRGFMLLVGFTEGDGSREIDYLVHKISKVRIFEDEAGKMNLDLAQVNGQILSVSQFTLYADMKKGNRPSFTQAQAPTQAEANYQEFNRKLADQGFTVATGVFGAEMDVELVNDGPTTIIYDTATLM